MKKLIYYSLFFLSFSLYGQNSWNVIIQDSVFCPDCLERKMITTSDGNFVILLGDIDTQGSFSKYEHRIIKYDNNGNRLWDKRYDFGVTEPAANGFGGARSGSSLIELDNGDLVMSGTYIEGDTSYCYFFRTDDNGDSLVVKMHDSNYCFYNFMYYNEEIFAIEINEITDEKSLIKFNIWGEKMNEILLGNHSIWDGILNGFGEFISARGNTTNIFKKFSASGALIEEKQYTDFGSILSRNDMNGVTAYYKGLIKLDANLTEIWHTPLEDLFTSIGSSVTYDGWDIEPTQDGGYILAGRAYAGGNWYDALVYLVKVDENGTREWGGLYSPFDVGLDFIFDVEPVSDGYVFTGGQMSNEKLWLAKVDEFGVFTDTEEIEIEKGELLLFPNPATEVVNIRWPDLITGSIQLFDASGGMLRESDLKNEKEFYFLVKDLLPGVYFILIKEEGTRKVINSRFIKK